MKKLPLIILSLLMGGLLTLGIIYIIRPSAIRTFRIEHISSFPARAAFYTVDEKGKIVPLDFEETARKAMDAVVNIQSTQNRHDSQKGPMDDDFFRYFFGPDDSPDNHRMEPQEQVGIGSGVIVNENGYIITNNHVVADASDLDVTLHDNRSYKAKVIGTDPSTDLALIKIDEKDLPVIPISNSDETRVGEWVLAVGNPYGLSSTVTAGIISAKSRSLNLLSDKNAIESFIQTDAAINPGNSGGALINLQGGLVGINTAIASPTGSYSGYGFAISSNIVNKVVEDLIRYGEVKRGFLGVMLRNITGKFAMDNNLKVNQGAYIDSVVARGGAAKAGIKRGDVIVGVDGMEIRQSSELQEIIAEHHPGENVSIVVNRNGETRKFNVELKPGAEVIEAKNEEKEKSNIESTIGAEFKTVDRDLAKKLGIDGGVQITSLRPGRLSSQTEVKEGFIILKVNDQPVKSVEELEMKLDKRKGSGVMLEGIYENVSGKFYYAFGM